MNAAEITAFFTEVQERLSRMSPRGNYHVTKISRDATSLRVQAEEVDGTNRGTKLSGSLLVSYAPSGLVAWMIYDQNGKSLAHIAAVEAYELACQIHISLAKMFPSLNPPAHRRWGKGKNR